MKLSAILVLTFVFLTNSLSHAATLSAGGGGGSKTNPPSTTLDSDEDDADNIHAKLKSNKTFDVKVAIQKYSKNLTEFIAKGQFHKAQLNGILEHLNDDSTNLHTAILGFLDKNLPALMAQGIITKEDISATRNSIYSNVANFRKFLCLYHAYLKNVPNDVSLVDSEVSFAFIDGLNKTEASIASLDAKLLTDFMSTFVKNGVWQAKHTTRFLKNFAQVPQENHHEYLKVLKAHLGTWVYTNMVDKEDVKATFALMKTLSFDNQESFFQFITNKDTIAVLQKLELFDRAWSDSLVADITGTDDNKREAALNLLTYLLKPFVTSGNFTKNDFQKIWSHIEADLGGYEDPFFIITQNFNNLVKSGWFSRGSFDKMVASFSDKDAVAQASILEFIDTNYDWLVLSDWLSATPLAKVVFSESADTSLQEAKLDLVIKHSDLITEIGIFEASQVAKVFEYLGSTDMDMFERAVKISNIGYQKWANQKFITPALLNTLASKMNPSAKRSAQVIQIFDKNFITTAALKIYDKAFIDTLSLFAQSSVSAVAKSTQDFFENNKAELRKNKLLTGKASSNLKGLVENVSSQRHRR